MCIRDRYQRRVHGIFKIFMAEPKFFAVNPKRDCPHISSHELKDLTRFSRITIPAECVECKNKEECWMCVKCAYVGCSQYKNGHMKAHADKEKHCITVSYSDLSFWCYECDSYIISNELIGLLKLCQEKKFKDENSVKEITEAMASLGVKQPEIKKEEEKKLPEEKKKALTIEEVAEKIKSGECKKIVVLTGAGISVAAGIPDFRTPGTGLYSQLEKYNLPFPEAVFALEFFRENPLPFYKLSSEMFGKKYLPTKVHYFIRLLAEKKILLRNYTQNIDNLEVDAGLKENLLIQCHGTYTTSHCIECKELKNQDKMMECLKKAEPMMCEKCNLPVKPDIVFFGEQLPKKFFEHLDEIENECDMLIVIGSSLQVIPVSLIPYKIKEQAPRLIINMEYPETLESDKRPVDVFFQGNCETKIVELVEKLGWKEDFDKMMKERDEYAAKNLSLIHI
eukprot:TRINITY_DN3287_c0_g4_i3.p1 TRINITY_DN3287_c0_g4~~TRINITY_DN3287_c0_g4_i3.p1  ORF type:complete len:466 (+),score=149.25 TRINITY_DN3287_c0_g4_i3:48-1400(+)